MNGQRSRNPFVQRTRRMVAALAVATTGLAWGGVAWADPPASGTSPEPPASSAKAPRIILYVEGAHSKELQEALQKGLAEGVESASVVDWTSHLKKEGQRLPYGLTLTIDSRRKGILRKVGASLAKAQIEGAIIGIVRPRRGGKEEVSLYAVGQGDEGAEAEQTIPYESATTSDAATEFAASFSKRWAAAPAKQEAGAVDASPKAPAGPTEPYRAKDWQRPANVSGHELVSVSAAFNLAGRFFNYSDGLSNNLRDYRVMGSPGVALDAGIYPFATTRIPLVSGLGVTGTFRISPGLSSTTSDGADVDTSWFRGGGGLRLRVPFGDDASPFVLAARVQFIRDVFLLETTGRLVNEVPSVDYAFVRGGLDGRFPIGPIVLTAFGDYLGAVAGGALYDRFRDPGIGGIDVGGGVAVPIAYGFEIFTEAEYVRWFYAFKPEVGDLYIAGGAVDENLHFSLGPRYVY